MNAYDIEKKLRLMKLAGLMRNARNQFSESHKVFEWLCEMDDWYYTECPNRDYILEDIISSVGGLAFLMFDKVNGFDGRQFRDMFWSYDTIELYAQGCLAPDQIQEYKDVCYHKRLDLSRCVDDMK
jgi:hypothetical protein